MKVKTLTLASVAGSLALAGGASAAFTGLSAVIISDRDVGGGTLVDTFQFYVNYDNPADQTIAVGGTPNNQQVLNSGGGGFYQNALGSNVPYNPAFLMFDPTLANDSYVSIGTLTTADGNPPSLQFFNTADFNNGSDTVTTTNGGWYLTPDDPETISGGASFIGQFSVAAGNTFSGNLGQLQTVEDGVSMTRGGADTAFSFTRVPAPGTLALLGLAGLAGTRRRRS